MSAAEFFTDVVLSYKRLLLSSTESVPGLRAYCLSRHVSYRDFIHWASTNENASGLIEIERKKKQLEKATCTGHKSVSSLSDCKALTQEKPLLYPLHIISDASDTVVEPVCSSIKLRGVSISFPNGVKVSVREADSKGIFFLVHGKVNQ
jgi:hypothetical protein